MRDGLGLYIQKEKRRLLELEKLYESHGESLYKYLVFRLGYRSRTVLRGTLRQEKPSRDSEQMRVSDGV